ncbi:MAG: glycosyltransferase family 1 protein [Kiritimatiellia bacterium]|nr:glycosyltransferase family 1 protein [Kiritimatiellia bacterium]MDP6629762.1 glycosyltransferase family 1 protein [Kiritimatiellia bacterium]MDP6811038.1 glycosyltransferase family 1 protein [Kiritimatiellia bacterium]MDP7023107.1 glycosyltransferase family 1 protein [Kiritimatiellia bacterium]
MRLAVSLLNYRPGHVGGIETYIRKLIDAFAAPDQEHEVHFIAGKDVATCLPDRARCQVVSLSGKGLVGWRCIEAFTPLKAKQVARQVDAAGYDAILFPQQSIFPIGIETPSVLTVVDVQHLHRPEHYGLFDTHFRRAIYPPSLDKSRRIIAISHATKQDLVKLCGIDEKKVTVIHMGFDTAPVAGAAPERVVKAPYFYYPAATFPHKGHADLLRCFARLKNQGTAPKLVFSGMQTPLWKNLQKQVSELGLAEDVIHVGFVPYEQVVSLYSHADAILFPSEFEGFGMPVLEAVRYGKPIFCSDLPVFEELGVPEENRLDFGDANALLPVMENLEPTVLSKPPISWARCAEKTLQVMAEAVR